MFFYINFASSNKNLFTINYFNYLQTKAQKQLKLLRIKMLFESEVYWNIHCTVLVVAFFHSSLIQWPPGNLYVVFT